MLDLDAIKARLAAATPGPWEEEREGGGYPTGVVYGPDCTVTSCDSEPGTLHQCTNAIFIANAPSDIAALVAEVERLNESTMTISWTERATEEACGVSVGLDPLSDVTWTSFYVGVEIRAFFVCLSQWERRVALAEVERLRAAMPSEAIVRTESDATALRVGRAVLGVFDFAYADAADVYAADVMDGTLSVRDSVHVTTLLRAIATAIRGEP